MNYFKTSIVTIFFLLLNGCGWLIPFYGDPGHYDDPYDPDPHFDPACEYCNTNEEVYIPYEEEVNEEFLLEEENDSENLFPFFKMLKNSRLRSKEVSIGSHLSGLIYFKVDLSGTLHQSSAANLWKVYLENVQNLWIEISPLDATDESFLRTYYIDQRDMSVNGKANSLGFIVHTDFIIIDDEYLPGKYILTPKLETLEGEIIEISPWSSARDHFNNLGFNLPAEDTLVDAPIIVSPMENENNNDNQSIDLEAEEESSNDNNNDNQIIFNENRKNLHCQSARVFIRSDWSDYFVMTIQNKEGSLERQNMQNGDILKWNFKVTEEEEKHQLEITQLLLHQDSENLSTTIQDANRIIEEQGEMTCGLDDGPSHDEMQNILCEPVNETEDQYNCQVSD